MPSVFLSTPCYGGLCLEGYAESLIRLQRTCAQNGIDIVLDTTENESLVHRARNLSIARFLLENNQDFFMFIDADIHFDPDSVVRLVNSGHDIAVAAYPKKAIIWEQAERAVKTGDNRDMSRLSSSLVLNFKYQNTPLVNGFAEVLDGPTGFMLIKREVIQKMYDHYRSTLSCVNDHQNRGTLTDYVAIFDCMIDPETKRYLSEDYAFCRRWQQMGGKIYADCFTTLGHIGNLRFSGCMDDRIKEEVT
jgi:glycosyltransferase involved in cell wall biosynthesis